MVKWSRNARLDLKNIYDFIARDSQYYALKMVREITEKVGMLVQFPTSGRIIAELNDELMREILCLPYRIMYRMDGGDITIITVVHARRDF